MSKKLIKFFDNIYYVNVDNLKINLKKKKIKDNYYFNIRRLQKTYKIIKFYNPKNILDFEKFIKNKYPLIINNFGRYLENILLLRLICKKKIPQAVVTNIGNVQASSDYFKGNLSHRLRNFFVRKLPYSIITILSNLGLISKIDLRFISNRTIYENYIKTSNLIKKLSYFKNYFLVDGILLKKKDVKKNLSSDYIVHLELDPDYPEITDITGEFDKDKVKKHYIKINNLLESFHRQFKKKVIISIHPKYNLKNAQKRFPKFTVVNKNVFNFVSKAFLITAFDSSVIVDAIQKKKNILLLESLLFKEKNYSTSLYKHLIDLKSIEIFNYEETNKNILKELKNKILNYQNYIDTYIKSGATRNPNKEIAKELYAIYKKYYVK